MLLAIAGIARTFDQLLDVVLYRSRATSARERCASSIHLMFLTNTAAIEYLNPFMLAESVQKLEIAHRAVAAIAGCFVVDSEQTNRINRFNLLRLAYLIIPPLAQLIFSTICPETRVVTYVKYAVTIKNMLNCLEGIIRIKSIYNKYKQNGEIWHQ